MSEKAPIIYDMQDMEKEVSASVDLAVQSKTDASLEAKAKKTWDEAKAVQPAAALIGKYTVGGKGKGKGKEKGKGKTRDLPKRHRHVLRDNIQGVTAGSIRRLARRGGVKRISGVVYDTVRDVLKEFVTGVIKDSIVYTEFARRKTVTAMDVVYALKRRGKTLYGYDS